MNHQNHQNHQELTMRDCFPHNQYPDIRSSQEEALNIMEGAEGSLSLELPTGTGKTALGRTWLEFSRRKGKGPLFYIAPSKATVDQVKQLHPEVCAIYGRNEYDCLYYEPEKKFKADEIPCSFLKDCPHRIDQETGETHTAGATKCPYLWDKYKAKQADIVVSTAAFYLFTQIFSKEWEKPAALVIDECHQMARVVRGCLSYDITDRHLARGVELLDRIDPESARQLGAFRGRMIEIIKNKPAKRPTILEDGEIRELLRLLSEMDAEKIRSGIGEALKSGKIDPNEDREALKQLEILTRDLYRYIRSFEFSLPSRSYGPLNYTYAFYTREKKKDKQVQYRLTVCAYYVRPIIQRLLSERTLAYSATLGDYEVFGFETGIEFPFYTLGSDFPAEKTRVYMPSDTPNLAVKNRPRDEPMAVLNRIAEACARFHKEGGHRSLVVVVSNQERDSFLEVCAREGIEAVSYGNGVTPKEAARRFKNGEGVVLVGTVANYGEGIDLPRQIAPVIFFLRPAYPPPRSPGAVFEERRFRSMRWALWNWRVMVEALQVRGRNVRSNEDLGVTFFISQQFRRFLYASLPEWLKPAYRREITLHDCVEDALSLLNDKTE